jgi:hypothetical protein
MRLLALLYCTQLGVAQWLMQAGARARSGMRVWHTHVGVLMQATRRFSTHGQGKG